MHMYTESQLKLRAIVKEKSALSASFEQVNKEYGIVNSNNEFNEVILFCRLTMFRLIQSM